MAFKVNSDAQLVFYAKVFGASHVVTQKVKALINAGVTFETGLYTLRAHGGGIKSQIKLSCGPSSLMKHDVVPSVLSQNVGLIKGWIEGIWQEAGYGVVAVPVVPPSMTTPKVILGIDGVPGNILLVIKEVRDIGQMDLKAAKQLVDAAKAGVAMIVSASLTLPQATTAAAKLKGAGANVYITVDGKPLGEALYNAIKDVPVPASVAVESQFKKVEPVPAVIDLKDAWALGQKVHGTSSGSVYYCVAVSDHVKVAARMYKGGSISLRAEWAGDPKDDLKKLKEAGLQMKDKYASLHFDAADVPMSRVIGAFLVGTGINWKAMVMNGGELVIGDKAW